MTVIVVLIHQSSFGPHNPSTLCFYCSVFIVQTVIIDACGSKLYL